MAAVLATFQRHSAPRGPRTARTGEGARDELHGYAPEDAPPQAAGAQHFAMDAGEDVGEAPAARRPAPLLEVLPQARVQQRTVEQIVDPVPVVPLLHVFVPQMVEQLVDILAPLDFRVAEQVIEVPKIVCPPRAARTSPPCAADGRPVGGSADDYLLFFVTTADYGAERCHSSSSWSWRAKRRSSRFSSEDRVQQRRIRLWKRISEQIVEQTVDIPAAGGGLADFRPGQSSSPVAHSPAAWLKP